MKYYPEIGITAKELDWVPSPTYILRRAAILDIIKYWPKGSAIEMGCGAGSICYELSLLGFECTAVETSERALLLAKNILKSVKGVTVTNVLQPEKTYDYLVSFEVLEHIKDDESAIVNWTSKLKPGGKLLLSVPAHQSRWNVTDITAGHFRRYDREDILKLMQKCDLENVQISTYGWPFSIAIEKIRNRAKSSQLRKQKICTESITLGDEIYTSESGIDRGLESRLFPFYGNWLGRKLFSFAAIAQRPFTKTDLGISFMVSASKRHGR